MSPISLSAYFLVGPTASGKSCVAHWIAQHEDYDVLSADSMSIYAEMTIGTAKPSYEERKRVSYSGIDLAAPDHSFNVWQYRIRALSALTESAAAGRTSLVVGGTGLYVKALTHGLQETAAPDPARRREWERLQAGQGV